MKTAGVRKRPAGVWSRNRTPFVPAFLLFLILTAGIGRPVASGQEEQAAQDPKGSLLKFLGVTPSPESVDYVQNKAQFQLHTLLTEQRHQKTWNLSERIGRDTAEGLRSILSVDEDVRAKLEALARESGPLERMAAAVEEAILQKNRVYVYGCGATGRLAKQMESTFWRPFWNRVKAEEKIWGRLRATLPADIPDRLSGEMTGADRALISSLEGFEDLQLIGRLQFQDHGIRKNDVIICVTEGGETSSVIGAILAAHDQWKGAPDYSPEMSSRKLFFVYNNPDDKLMPFLRSRSVLTEPGITKINLTTGPQAITGSTRMQATTIETFVIGSIVETAAERVLRRFLSKKEMARIGFEEESSLGARLKAFAPVLEEVGKSAAALARLTDLEAQAYASGHYSTYFAEKGLITVFIDGTERSPTFRLYPLDTVMEPKRKCWIQVWTPAADLKQAWQAFLGRPFRGLHPELYQKAFEERVEDPYLRTAALASLKRAGEDQQALYDFSFSETNIKKRGPKKDDLGVAVLISPEDSGPDSAGTPARAFWELFQKSGGRTALLLVSEKEKFDVPAVLKTPESPYVHLVIGRADDPMTVRQQVALKMLLNAHSTAVMAKLGRVVGNTMTNVSPSNLKLIGRATYLIQSHANDVLTRPGWVKLHGTRPAVSYGEANAVLFDSIAYLKARSGQTAEVALSIIRILESLRRKQALNREDALAIVQKTGLSKYLSTVTSPIK